MSESAFNHGYSSMNESLDDIRTRKQKEYDAKKSVSFPDELKSDAEKLLDCREAIRQYQAIVMEQEIKLVELQVEACLRANNFKELVIELKYINTRLDDRSQVIAALRTEKDDLCNQLNLYQRNDKVLRQEIAELYDELNKWRNPTAY